MTEELIRSARELTGTQKLAELRSRPPDREVVLRLVEAYVLWAKSFHEPPSKPSNSLRPIVAPVTGMAQVDEVNFALKALMVTESVAISITDTLSYMGRLAATLGPSGGLHREWIGCDCPRSKARSRGRLLGEPFQAR